MQIKQSYAVMVSKKLLLMWKIIGFNCKIVIFTIIEPDVDGHGCLSIAQYS